MENMLNCFKGFKCIKGACKKSCCTLWQIEVDKKTLKKYKKVKGEFKCRIDNGVNFHSSSLCVKDGRCAFLNKDNLCDIIINLGEEYLSEVCAIHPRFINKFKGYTEMGIGLSCEEGARLLINYKGKIAPTISPNVNKLKGFEREIIIFRQTILQVVYSESSLKEKLAKILSLLEIDENAFLSLPYKKFLSRLEVLDENWKNRLNLFTNMSLEIEQEKLLNVLVYFIYRHLITAVDKLDLKSKTLFSIFSTLAIHNIYINTKKVQNETPLLIEIARDYSAEIEYSEENLFNLLDLFEEFIVEQEIKNKKRLA